MKDPNTQKVNKPPKKEGLPLPVKIIVGAVFAGVIYAGSKKFT